MRVATAWLALSCAVSVPAQDRSDGASAFRAVVARVEGATAIELDDGRRIRLQGIGLPAPVVRPPEYAQRVREWISERAVGAEVLIRPDGASPVDDDTDLTATVYVDGASLNVELLARGLALFSCRTPNVASMVPLLDAARSAQEGRRGWFARSPRGIVEELPYLNGAVLGMHHRDRARGYARELDELAGLGFRHVTFIFSGFLHDVRAWRIDRHHVRSVADAQLVEAIRHARTEHGMTVHLLPIVLLEESNDEDWRGTIRPEPEARFWLEYDTFLSHYLDIAEATGAEMVSVGSELGSLEDRTATWRRLIVNARGRYTGLLTYSANWDHVHVPRFFDALDAVGMTAYFSLSEDRDADLEALTAGWRDVGERIGRTVARIERPVFFTELGYASQNGINTDPWNYFIAIEDVDLAEQRDCFLAALAVLPELEYLFGAYWFDYFGEGGRGDSSYTPRGKPAVDVWRRWAAHRSDKRIPRIVN